MRYEPIDRSTMEDIGTLWSMQHGERRARCALLTCAGDWEVRVLIDDAALLTQRCEAPAAAFTLAEEWKRRLAGQGWRQILLDRHAAAGTQTSCGLSVSRSTVTRRKG